MCKRNEVQYQRCLATNVKFIDDEWPTEGKIVEIQKAVCAVGYGDGYTINEVERDFYSELDNMANWQLHEEY